MVFEVYRPHILLLILQREKAKFNEFKWLACGNFASVCWDLAPSLSCSKRHTHTPHIHITHTYITPHHPTLPHPHCSEHNILVTGILARLLQIWIVALWKTDMTLNNYLTSLGLSFLLNYVRAQTTCSLEPFGLPLRTEGNDFFCSRWQDPSPFPVGHESWHPVPDGCLCRVQILLGTININRAFMGCSCHPAGCSFAAGLTISQQLSSDPMLGSGQPNHSILLFLTGSSESHME
jgi:hypothetical protein